MFWLATGLLHGRLVWRRLQSLLAGCSWHHALQEGQLRALEQQGGEPLVTAQRIVALGLRRFVGNSSSDGLNWLELHNATSLCSSRVTRQRAPWPTPTSSIYCDHLPVASLQPADAQPASARRPAGGQDQVVGSLCKRSPLPANSNYFRRILAVCGPSQCQFVVEKEYHFVNDLWEGNPKRNIFFVLKDFTHSHLWLSKK